MSVSASDIGYIRHPYLFGTSGNPRQHKILVLIIQMLRLGRLTVLSLRHDQQMIGPQNIEEFIPSYAQGGERFFQQVIQFTYSYARHHAPNLLHKRYDLRSLVLTVSYTPPVAIVLLS